MGDYQEDSATGSYPRPGMSWSFDLDLPDLLTALGVPAADPDADQEAVLAAEEAAIASAQAEPVELTGRVADVLPAGPGLAAWLAGISLPQAGDRELPAILAAFRRVASWAQARELETAALIASRCAADNPRIDTDDSGRPVQLPPEAAAQVALALGMSQFGASAWTGLGMQLGWQLPGTSAALGSGQIDLGRARLIAEAAAALPDRVAKVVEDRVLPSAGHQTNGQLRASLRRAVIAADPEGAEQRRRDAERAARVSLHPDEEGTATLTGSNLPGVHAAAAMARISAMARALKASGAHGGIDLLRVNIFLGLLLGTLPVIPPPESGPFDDGPSDDGPSDGSSSDGGPSDGSSSDGGPSDGGPSDGGSSDGPCGTGPSDDGRCDSGRSGESCGNGPSDDGPCGNGASDDALRNEAPYDEAPCDEAPCDEAPCDEAPCDGGPRADVPPPGDADAPWADTDPGSSLRDDFEFACDEDADDLFGPPPPWPPLPAEIPSADSLGGPDPSRAPPGRPPLGLLDVVAPWPVLAGGCCDPAVLGRIGPVTRYQARELVALGSASIATRWRVVLTDDDGHALAVEGFRLPALPAGRPATGHATTAVVGRVTITIRASQARVLLHGDGGSMPSAGTDRRHRVLGAAANAARRAADRLEGSVAADAAIGGQCAHTMSSASYRPPPRLREYVGARDVTCRSVTCGQPAWRGDLDHTVPWHSGGITCSCDLGALCRTHHKIKQLPGWRLEQGRPGYFTWTTPAGQVYDIGPDPYPV